MQKKYQDVTLPPQERFRFLINVGLNIDVSKKIHWDTYVKMRHDIIEMAEHLQNKGLDEEAFVLYHNFLTWEPAIFISFPMTDPSLIMSSSLCFLSLLNPWNLTNTSFNRISGSSHTYFSLLYKDMREFMSISWACIHVVHILDKRVGR